MHVCLKWLRRFLPILALLLLPACREIDEIIEEPTPAADTIESGDFERLWTAAKIVLNRNFTIMGEDRPRGRILARGRPAESYMQNGKRHYYSDTSNVVVEVRIDREGAENLLSVRAAVERESMGPDGFRRFSPRDRYYGNAAPALMRAASVEQEILRQIREELEGKR
ncbi:MAG: hypothetical protein GXP25_18080 [Planctomycetes bacterium]|nr:hypothetical protein [Planctomycetota bacterium]